MGFRGRIALISFSLGLMVLVILVFSTSSWLETETGRKLLQRELGKSLSLEAELRGDYSLKLFPGIRIAGKQLLLSPVNSNQALAEIKSYELHLALRPLLRKEILIHEVVIDGGSLDLDLLTGQSGTGEKESAMQIPKIDSMVISGLILLQSGKEFLQVSNLNVQGFAESRKAPISLSLSLPTSYKNHVTANLEGVMQVEANPLITSFDVRELMLVLDGQSWPLGAGHLKFSGETGEFVGDLEGELSGYASKAELALQTKGAIWVQGRIELRSKDSGLLAASLKAHKETSRWLLEQVELDLDGQLLVGAGCLETNDPVRLQLQLQAEQLNLDAVQDLLPVQLLTGGSETESTLQDLPLQLAIELKATQASAAGAVAKEVRLLLGDKPDCTANPVNN